MAKEELEQIEDEDLHEAEVEDEDDLLEATDDEETEEELVEFQASGEASSVPDPIETGSSRRKADKTNAMPMQKLGKTGVIAQVVDAMAGMTPGQAGKVYKGITSDAGNKSSIKAKENPGGKVKLHTMANIKVKEDLESFFGKNSISHVVHLAAQAGVRYSIENPKAYIDSNISGFLNILEGCRAIKCSHLIYGSSSSVYGANTKFPFSEKQNANHPIQIYAATKRSNELMAHSYSHLFKIPTTGLRFFTVYGPWGRPDMALHLFAESIIKNKPIKLFNYGKHRRDLGV